MEHSLTVDKYFTKDKGLSAQLYDSTYFYYSKYLKTGYSISRKMDSISGMRLCKVTMIFNEAYNQEKALIRKRVLSYEVQDALVRKPGKILRLFVDFGEKRRLLGAG